MSVTIREIALEVGVSIATVSYALNRTKYVSPELSKRIWDSAREMGYTTKQKDDSKRYRSGKSSEIAFVVSNTKRSFCSQIIMNLSKCAAQYGYLLSVHLSEDDPERERHILTELMSNRRIAGIILSPFSENMDMYKKLKLSEIPLVCIERTIAEGEFESVLSDTEQGVYRGTEHLIKCGHENIALLLEKRHKSSVEERENGYKKALENYHIAYRSEMVVCVDANNEKLAMETIRSLMTMVAPTAIFAGGNKLTLLLLKVISELGLNCPMDVSIVGYGDDEWSELVLPPLTTLKKDVAEIGKRAIGFIVNKINLQKNELEYTKKIERVPMELRIRNSTQNIARGPFGEKAAYPEEIVLSEEDAQRLKKGEYKVAISFHYSGDEWTRLHERAIRDTLNAYGIQVLSVADAHFDPSLQNIQLEVLMMQKPDAVIAVPADEEKTAEKFKEISKRTKLILINSMPHGLTQNDYACWISVNERENGQNSAKILGDYFEGQKNVKVGILAHGAQYFATNQRDFFAEQMLRDNYSNVEVVEKRNFYAVENTYEECKKMMRDHPEIKGLYITWERPALEAIKALKDLGRTDVVITTTDLDFEIASYMARREMVIGLSSQRPYDQGVVVAIATAKALLNKCEKKCIGVPPYTVEREKLEKAWRDLTKTQMPNLAKNYPK